MVERSGPRQAMPKAIRDGIREIERNEEMRAAHRALRASWLRYDAPRHGDGICSRCGDPLAIGTAYLHCAACLATRGIDEDALRRACARALEQDWPFIERPLDPGRWARTLIAFWREHVDPAEAPVVPYRTATLASAFQYMQRHVELSGVASVWTAPFDAGLALYPAMVVRARGEALALGVGTQPRVATGEDGRRRALVAAFDAFLELAGEGSGVLVVEKLSRRATRDDPITEVELTTAGGRRVTQLRCMQEDRACVVPAVRV